MKKYINNILILLTIIWLPAAANAAGDITNLKSISHTTGIKTQETNISFTWDVVTDGDGYSYELDKNHNTEPDADPEIDFNGGNMITLEASSDSTSWFFHVRAVGPNNTAGTTAHLGPFVIDTTPPTNPLNFAAAGGEEQISLAWTNPADTDFAGIKIVYRTDGAYPTGPNNGSTLIEDTTFVKGEEVTYNHTNIDNQTTYHYAIFSYDNIGNYSTGQETHSTSQSIATTISDIQPFNGQNDGETEIIIHGTGFPLEIAEIRIGITACTQIERKDSTTLTALVPAGIERGLYDLTIITPDSTTVKKSTFTVTNPPGINVSAISGNTTEEGGTTTFTIKLNSQPKEAVSMNLTSTNIEEGTVTPPTITFTSTNWNSSQTITVTGVDDAIADGDQTYIIEISTATSEDTKYHNIDPDDITVINEDRGESSGIAVSTITGNTTEEGDTATLTLRLDSEPEGEVTLDINSTNTAEGTVFPETVTFTPENWDLEQIVTVTGADDFVADGDQIYSVTINPSNSQDPSYQLLAQIEREVINEDRGESVAIIVTEITGSTSETGESATFTLRLNSEPTDPVNMEIISSDQGEGTVLPSSLTFSSENWNMAQTLTVTGVDDIEVDGDQQYTIILNLTGSEDPAYSGLDPENVMVKNSDNDKENSLLNPELIYPPDGSTGLGATVAFEWKKVETENNQLQYHFYHCENPEFSGCGPEKNIKNKAVYLAGLGGTGVLLTGLFFFGGINDKKYVQLIAVMVLSGTFLIACGSSSGSDGGSSGGGNVEQTQPPDDTLPGETNNMVYTVSGLKSETTYYWKVVCTDENNGVGSSEVRSYTTE